MERYSLIHKKLPREFVLLQGTGCRWRGCTFCDYHSDISPSPFETNRSVLEKVTGHYGVLDVINSGSAIELDEESIKLLQEVVKTRGIHTLWFEMHYMYRHRLADFAARFAPAVVKFRCGIESFDPTLRQRWNKGVPAHVSAADVAQYFQGVCLLCCTEGDSRERILSDIDTAHQLFEYFSINVFCENTTQEKADKELAKWFAKEVAPSLTQNQKAEVLLNNTDLGVG